MDILHYIVFNWVFEKNQTIKLVIGTINITTIDITYIWYYNIVANMTHIELILPCEPIWIITITSILHYIASDIISEIIFNQ